MPGSKGELLATSLIFVHEKNRQEEASNKVRSLIHTYQPEAFAIGDGTAGRETEQFIRSLSTGLPVFLVNEDGASIYSASEVAPRVSRPGYYCQGRHQHWPPTDGSFIGTG